MQNKNLQGNIVIRIENSEEKLRKYIKETIKEMRK